MRSMMDEKKFILLEHTMKRISVCLGRGGHTRTSETTCPELRDLCVPKFIPVRNTGLPQVFY